MTRNTRYALFALAFIAFEIFLIAFVDRPVSDYLRGIEATYPAVTDFFRAYTDFAKAKWYLVPSAIGMVICAVLVRTANATTRKKAAIAGHQFVFFFAAVAVSGLITGVVKRIIGRARPVEMLREHIYGFHPFTFNPDFNGMPSGHSTTAAAVATALIILFPRGKFLWIFAACAFAISRIMVNAHYCADVFAGIAVGTLTTLWLLHVRNAKGIFPLVDSIFPIDKKTRNSLQN